MDTGRTTSKETKDKLQNKPTKRRAEKEKGSPLLEETTRPHASGGLEVVLDLPVGSKEVPQTHKEEKTTEGTWTPTPSKRRPTTNTSSQGTTKAKRPTPTTTTETTTTTTTTKDNTANRTHCATPCTKTKGERATSKPGGGDADRRKDREACG